MKLFRLFLILFFIFNSLNATIILTDEEKDWISKNPIIKVGVDENWPPFDFVDVSNKHQGIASEYLSFIAASTGLNFEIHSNKWKNIINKIQKKELDILACAANTEERRAYINFTEPYANVDIVVVSKKNLSLKNFDDIRNYTVAVPKSNFVHENLKKRFPKIKFKFVDSNEQALIAVSYGDADIYVGNLPVVTYFIDKYFLTNLEVKFKADFEAAKLSIAVLKEHEILQSILQKGLDNISFEEKEKINKRWVFKFKKEQDRKTEGLSLSPEELNWISENKEIKIGGDGFWHPYSYYDEDGNYVGIIPDIVALIKKKSGLNFKYVYTKTWSETLSLMKEKKIDAIDAISYTKKRSEFLNFSLKYYGTDIVILGKKEDAKYINSIEKIINKYKVATVRDYVIAEIIKKDYPGIDGFREYDSAEDGLKALASNQVDYFILDIPSFDYYSKKYSLSNIKILGPTGYNFDYGFGVYKENKYLLSIINKILRDIPKEEIDKIYRKWVKIDYEDRIDYELIWQIVFIALLILLGTLYWNRRLQNEISEKEKVQKKLSHSNDFINAIMNSQADIIVVSNGVEINQVNQSFLSFFKYENLDEFKKDYRCICDLFDTTDEENYLVPKKDGRIWIDKILDNPNSVHKAKIIIENEEFIFKVAASRIENKSHLKTAVFHNITELENLHKDLVNAKNKALVAAKHKSEFLANMSHEIRTPMNSIIGFTEILEKEISDPVQKDYLNSIKKGGNSLLRIINDILDLSKIEAGKLEIKNESIDLRNLISELESIFHSKIVSKNINFIIEVDSSIPNFIIIDSVRIRQILFNLIGNAIKFTEEGDIKLKVHNIYKDDIKSKIDLIMSVEDSGIGIDDNHLKRIFNAFEQSDQDSTKYGGTGLGLSICSKLVQMMNGKIEVQSKKGVGSTFSFKLSDIPVSSLGEEIVSQKLDYSNITFQKATLLVVDDVKENRKLVEASLKGFDFKIIMAENGEEALERLKNVKVDLILMDLRMPVLDGYKATVSIKNDEKLKEIPVIALTASVMGKDLKKVKKYGFDGYLRKPVILDDLIEEISKFLKYDFIVSNSTKLEEEIPKLDLEALEKTITSLKGSLKDEWKEIKDKGDFSLIEVFVENLGKISNKNKILQDYIDSLNSNINAFDIEKVDYLMNSYEDIINKIEKLKSEIQDNE